MPHYAAVLGHQPHISIAELSAAVPGFEFGEVIRNEVILFSTEEELDSDFMARLGGTVVIAEKIEDGATIEDIPRILLGTLKGRRGKMTFSLRCFGLEGNAIKRLYRRCKDLLKNNNIASRYVGNEKKAAIPVLLHDNDMLSGKKGCELLVLANENDIDVYKTIGAQDVNMYTWRDMEKPVRDMTVGILPPKLAQVMLNFGAWLVRDMKPAEDVGKKKKKKKTKEIYTVYDPFCGTGVIPMECLLLGWNVLASDSSQKAVNGCQKNLEWLRKELKILKKDVSDKVWKHDATKAFDPKLTPDMIVTETTLGPNFTDRPTQKDAKKLKTENEKIQIEFLKNASEQYPETPIICMWPVWYVKGSAVMLEKPWDIVHELGYTPVLPASVEPRDATHFSIIYRRKDQFVGREIVMLKPKKN